MATSRKISQPIVDRFFPVAENDHVCYYTRYPNGDFADPLDLLCPECGEGLIEILEEMPYVIPMMLGDLAQCWTCKHQFRITENCWKWRKVGNES